jgi:hypothetical protein
MMKKKSNKKLILFLLIFWIFALNGISQNVLIADFKIEVDSSTSERERILDERNFYISPNKELILIVGHKPIQRRIYSTPVLVAAVNDGEKVYKKVFEIAYSGIDDLLVKWTDDDEIQIKYFLEYESLIIEKKNEIALKNKKIRIRYQDINQK